MSDLMLDVGQANELKLAFRRADFSNDDIKRLCEGNVLVDVRSVLRGHASIAVVQHVIDCDANPFNPWANDGFTIEEHQKGGQWKFDPKQVEFFLSSGQKDGKVIEGNKLRKELAKKSAFNANVLDYLLAHLELIPDEWKTDGNGNTRYIFFWGTVYRRRDGYLCVRCLDWSGGRWRWSFNWLGSDWIGYGPAAVRAS
ncbi:MAG TPA: hypothetical protein VMV38_01005 [Candidatus Paceibacterota bacterium]|nr:hypothetical protein [Candidatus Paceibacterota bacterium]